MNERENRIDKRDKDIYGKATDSEIQFYYICFSLHLIAVAALLELMALLLFSVVSLGLPLSVSPLQQTI